MKRIIVLVVLVFMSCKIWAYDRYEYDETNRVTWYFNVIKNSNGGYDAEITYGSPRGGMYQGVLTIPSTLGRGMLKVTSIGADAFFSCFGLESVSIPSGVTTIGDSAFKMCPSLTSIVIPESVTTIGENAFYDCGSLTSVAIPEGVETIGNGAFSCSNLMSVAIPSSVTTIGENAFYGCDMLKSVVISNGVTTIGKGAFARCTSLTSVIILNGMTTIGDGAFWGCNSLTTMRIPSSVTTIGSDAFVGCDSLSMVYTGTRNAGRLWGQLQETGAPVNHIGIAQMESPTITPQGKTVISDVQTVSIATEVEGSVIYYTIDGSIPTEESLVYSRKFRVNSKCVVRAIFVNREKFVAEGCISDEARSEFAFGQCPDPQIQSAGGVTFCHRGNEITIDYDCDEGIVRYTMDGSEPTDTSPEYTGPFTINETTLIRAKAFSDRYFDSEVVSLTVTREWDQTSAVKIVAKDDFVGSTEVVLSCVDTDAAVYYTLDGSTPTSESIRYETPFRVYENVVVKAIAVRDDYLDSEVATVSLTQAQAARPVIVTPDSFTGSKTVAAIEHGADSAVYYTLDGSIPTRDSYAYNAPIEIIETTTIKAIAVRTGCRDSEIVNATITKIWTIGDTLLSPDQQFSTSGSMPWVDENKVAMRSGSISDNQESVLSTVVDGPGVLKFEWKTSCEDSDGYFDYDRVELRIDGELSAVLDGKSDWIKVLKELNEGRHRVEWAYVKDGEECAGEDCAWVRSFVWAPKSSSGDELDILPATADYTYDGMTFVHSGWINDVGLANENFTIEGMALGPNGTKVSAVVDGHHPWTENSLPEAFTLSVYTDLSMITGASSLSKAVIWSTGDLTHNRVMLLTDGANVILSASGGDCISLPLPSPGYHLITAVFSASGIKLVIDDGIGDDRVAIHTGVYGSIAAGFQIGSVCGDLPRGYRKPIGLPIAKMVGYSKALAVAQIALLSELYPASTTATGVVNYSVSGGMFYVGSMTHTDGRLEIDCGTLIVPDGQTYSVPALRFGNCGSNGDTLALGLELDGTLIISGGQTADGYDGDGVRSDVVNNRGGILCGEWTGRGTYNIRGILDASNSFVQLADNAYMQTWNIENGGLLRVKAIEARTMSLAKQTAHVLNVKDGGRVVSTQGFIRGKLIANVEDGGILEIANTANVDMKDADLSGITGEGQFKISNAFGSGYTLLPSDPTKFFADTLEFVAESEFYLTAGGDFTIGSLSGTGCLNTMYTLNGVRTLTIKQSKDTTWSGDVVADGRRRLSAIKVLSENESILTLAGTNNQPYAPILLLGGGRVKTTGSGMTVASGVVGMDVKCEDEIFSLVWAISAPTIEGDAAAEVIGDTESGFVVKPSEGTIDVVVMIPEGVDAEKVTIEVSPIVQLVKANGAKIKVVKGAADITEFLDVPAAINGVIDLSAAVVKPEVAAEAMDITKGAEITLSATNPTITTAPTKPGLTYTLVEGATIESMGAGASKLGDGTAWTPEIKVKGGVSAFYSIKVTK